MQPWFSKYTRVAAYALLASIAFVAAATAQVVVIQPSDSTKTAEADGDDGRITVRTNDVDLGDLGHITINIDDGDSDAGIVRFGDNITIKRNELVRGDVVAIGGSIRNEGKIEGDCVAIGGSVHVLEGSIVDGEVVSIGGSLTLEPGVIIDGDAVSVWGRLKKDDTALVHGDVVQVGGLGPIAWGGTWGDTSGLWQISSLARRLIWVGILLGLGALLFQVFPGQMTHLTETIQGSGIKAFFWGLLFWILWLPIVIALCITVIGIVAALGLIFLTPIIMLLGYLAAAKALGLRLTGGVMQSLRPFLMGLIILEGGVILARLIGMGGALGFLAMILSTIAATAIFLATTTGVGALLITRFRSKPKADPALPAEAEPEPLPPSATTA